MRKILLIGLLLLPSVSSAGTYTTDLNLYKPAKNDTNYVTPFATGMDTLDAAIPDKRVGKTATFNSTITINTPLTVNSSGTFTVTAGAGDETTPITIQNEGTYSSVSLAFRPRNLAEDIARLTSDITGIGRLNSFSIRTVDSAGTLFDRIFIDEDGLVGIGTTAPTEKLDVLNGNIKTNYGVSAATGVFTSTVTATAVTMGTAASPLPNTTTDAQVSIAKVSSAGLDTYIQLISSAATRTGTMLMSVGSSGARSSAITAYENTTLGTRISMTPVLKEIAFQTGTTPTTQMVVVDTKVGIGTTAPSGKLDVAGGIVNVSTSATSSASLCFVGAVTALPTTGYNRGCLAYLTTDPTSLYISTETVVSVQSWLAK